jgi:hypothetical protein
MRTYILIIAFIAICFYALAEKASDHFAIDESRIKAEMADLTVLEHLVNEQGITRSELYNQKNELAVRALDPSYSAVHVSGSDDRPPLGIPSFLWGMCFGGVGILLVYLVTEDQVETKKALYGCIVMGVISSVFTVIYYIALMNFCNDLP